MFMSRPVRDRACGYSLVELLLVISLLGILAGVAVPVTRSTIDELRAAGAARHVAARVAAARLDAVRRSSTVALRFERAGADYAFTRFLDGNGNGLRAADITSGADRPLGRAERLHEFFAGTSFGLLPGIPDLNGATGSTDGVRIGSTSILSISPNGSCTSGTLYVRGRRSQFAIRILGATGRVRLFRYDFGTRQWITR
jgi:prepilin-type N-terminal cleavage/methylation domain-containing protein